MNDMHAVALGATQAFKTHFHFYIAQLAHVLVAVQFSEIANATISRRLISNGGAHNN